MEFQSYICSDTNIWIDFSSVNCLELPFRLEHIYLMCSETFEREILTPPDLHDSLLQFGLQTIDLTEDEFQLAHNINLIHKALSLHDSFAFAIAKIRNIPLLTGDKRLRAVAEANKIPVIGTIGILNRLYSYNKASNEELLDCAYSLKNMIGKGVRLPQKYLDEFILKIS